MMHLLQESTLFCKFVDGKSNWFTHALQTTPKSVIDRLGGEVFALMLKRSGFGDTSGILRQEEEWIPG